MTATEFWDWFSLNNHQFLFINEIDDPGETDRILEELLTNLHKYNPHLLFEIGGRPNDDKELIITAEGNREHFKSAEDLVEAAPQLKGWHFFALKPPRGSDFTIEIDGTRLNPKEVGFMPFVIPSPEGNSLGLVIAFPGMKEEEEDQYFQIALLGVTLLLGERDATEYITGIEVIAEEDIEEGDEFFQLASLREWVQTNYPEFLRVASDN